MSFYTQLSGADVRISFDLFGVKNTKEPFVLHWLRSETDRSLSLARPMSSSLEGNHNSRSTKQTRHNKQNGHQNKIEVHAVVFLHVSNTLSPTFEFSSSQLRAQGSLLFRIQGDPSRRWIHEESRLHCIALKSIQRVHLTLQKDFVYDILVTDQKHYYAT